MDTKEINEALRDVAERIPVRSHWQHKKGGKYMVSGYAFHTETQEVLVRYWRYDGPSYDHDDEQDIEYARPVSLWTEDRFTRIPGEFP
jgi:hypothetical protein